MFVPLRLTETPSKSPHRSRSHNATCFAGRVSPNRRRRRRVLRTPPHSDAERVSAASLKAAWDALRRHARLCSQLSDLSFKFLRLNPIGVKLAGVSFAQRRLGSARNECLLLPLSGRGCWKLELPADSPGSPPGENSNSAPQDGGGQTQDGRGSSVGARLGRAF